MKDADDIPYGRLCDLDGDGKLDLAEEMLAYDFMEEDRLRSKAYFERVREERERERRAREETGGLSFGSTPAKAEEKKPEEIRIPKSDDDYVRFWRSAHFVSRAILILTLVVLVSFITLIPTLTSEEYGFVLFIGSLALLVYMVHEFVSSREKENEEFAKQRNKYLATLDEVRKAALDKRMKTEKLKKALRTTAWLVPLGTFAVLLISSSF